MFFDRYIHQVYSIMVPFVNVSDYQQFPIRDLQRNLIFTNPDLQKLQKNMKDYPVILEISKDFHTKICKNFSDFQRFPKYDLQGLLLEIQYTPLCVKARKALNTKMKKSSKARKKSGGKPCKTLEPFQKRNYSRHFSEHSMNILNV